MGRTQEQRKAETRQRLLAAAAELFAAKGVHAVSLEAVAEAADRTTGAIYAHFGGKDGLLLALLDETSRHVGRETRGALAAADDTDERLRTLWGTFAEHADAPDDPWMLLEHELWLHAARNPETQDLLATRFQTARRLMGSSWDAWAAETDRPLPMRGDRLATLVLALLYGLDMQRRVDPDAVSDDLAVAGLRLLFDLVSTPSPNKETTHAHRAV
jgi:AcrR family transcriptional regulator